MKLFECQNCGQLIYFENTQCERCGHALGFLPDAAMMTALEPNGAGAFTPLADPKRSVVYCNNFTHGACNWLIDAGGDDLCQACKLNRTIPDLGVAENSAGVGSELKWRSIASSTVFFASVSPSRAKPWSRTQASPSTFLPRRPAKMARARSDGAR